MTKFLYRCITAFCIALVATLLVSALSQPAGANDNGNQVVFTTTAQATIPAYDNATIGVLTALPDVSSANFVVPIYGTVFALDARCTANPEQNYESFVFGAQGFSHVMVYTRCLAAKTTSQAYQSPEVLRLWSQNAEIPNPVKYAVLTYYASPHRILNC